MPALDIFNTFLAHHPIPGVLFEHNDYVQVVAGRHKGQTGSLVSILSLEPEPSFILESESGSDLRVLQSELARVGGIEGCS